MSRSRIEILKRKEPLRVGVLPVVDAAPLVYAAEGGLFEKYGLEVQLQRETSWGNVRDKVISGDLDAAPVPATLPFLSNLGLESDPCACVSGLVLSLQGNGIVVSQGLWDKGVRDALSLRELIYDRWRRRTFTLGVTSALSVQEILLRRWLESAGIKPGAEVRIVSVPPVQLFPTMKLGYIDGYCAGEPWISLAAQAGVGVCLARSSGLAPRHPEKVMMARLSFAIGRADEHERLLAALLEACAFCDQPANREMLSEMLAHPQYLNAPAEAIKAGLVEPPASREGHGAVLPELTIFHGQNANDPTEEKAQWVMDGLGEMMRQEAFRIRLPGGRPPVFKNIFRQDIFQRARAALLKEYRQNDREVRMLRSGTGADCL